ncbi:hypothetical protein ST45_01185 [Prevotella pectinovora]|nr:hypothetical protein ST45_01185 [Prevotella pectinovora]
MADNHQTVNSLFARTLQRKTRWSDSFFAILDFTKNQRYWQLLLILLSKNHGLSPNDRFGIKNKRFYFGIVFVFTIFANIKVKTRQIIIK